ncbi:MAG: hypothetical protein KBH10_00105 [Laribacter sp.]|nr:hypothetical protein [Laribacter sp.]
MSTAPGTVQAGRFNGRISEVLATHRIESGQGLSTTLERYVLLYNQHLLQLARNTGHRFKP